MHFFSRDLLILSMLVVFLLGATGGGIEAQGGKVVDLKNYQWKNRILLIFAPSAENPAGSSLAVELEGQIAGVRERELLIGHILEIGPSQFAGVPISRELSEAFRRQFAVRTGISTVILIGKDGEVKLRREGPVQATEIFALIDSMPMRRQEMREGK
jgi:hypothetical protein